MSPHLECKEEEKEKEEEEDPGERPSTRPLQTPTKATAKTKKKKKVRKTLWPLLVPNLWKWLKFKIQEKILYGTWINPLSPGYFDVGTLGPIVCC